MNEDEVKELLKKYNLTWIDFLNFMRGQTVGYDKGIIDYYDNDVMRFIRK